MSAATRELFELVDVLPDAEKMLAMEMVKRIVLAWDPDYTKMTPAEQNAWEHGLAQIEAGETLSMEELARELNL